MKNKTITKNENGQIVREVTEKYIRTWNYDEKTGKVCHYSHTNLGVKIGGQ